MGRNRRLKIVSGCLALSPLNGRIKIVSPVTPARENRKASGLEQGDGMVKYQLRFDDPQTMLHHEHSMFFEPLGVMLSKFEILCVILRWCRCNLNEQINLDIARHALAHRGDIFSKPETVWKTSRQQQRVWLSRIAPCER